MFVFNVNFSKLKKTGIVFALLSAAAAVVCVICMVLLQSDAVSDTATCDELGSYSLAAETTEEECAFLEQFSLTADEDSAQTEEITIPETFNDTYEEYNDIQKAIGLDLERYSGKEALKITYALKNSNADYAVLLVYKGRVIGAHLTNGEYGEENQPLV